MSLKLRDRIVQWLRQQVAEADARGLVVGMSGGLDSSVVAILAKEAMGSRMLGLMLPCQSSREDLVDARALAEEFDIEYRIIDLTPVYHAIIQILPPGDAMAMANLKPRLRMVVLYYFANVHNYLVVGTGNKSELMTGYFTKYGDGGVDVLPLGGTLKTEVKELAKEVGVPHQIRAKPPSAGLWEGQTDEEEIGISYNDLDRLLKAMDRGEEGGLSPEKVNMIKSLMASTAHKRMTAKVFDVSDAD